MAGYIRLVLATSRITFHNKQTPDGFWNAGKPFILAFWHGQMVMLVHSWQTTAPVRMLISRNHDGQLIAAALAHFGISSVRGSSDKDGKDKGGRAAAIAMVRALRKGECIGFTPDGPKGPRMRAKDGIITVAKMAGVPIIPVAAASNRRKVFGSWDRFCLDKPFSRAAIVWGAPIHVARDADAATIAATRLHLEVTLNDLSCDASKLAGCPLIEPAALTPAAKEATPA
ncbi:lysophospholipid acyltransferase family protein [Pyruvatibacter sp.]|uniref:lysophospholipid acyltransferase family protein n=1 Tax=Pyruvatibacter sp. TaxID=1981328 RepID=UPI0032ECFA34